MRRLLSFALAFVVLVGVFAALHPAAAQRRDLDAMAARFTQLYTAGNLSCRAG
jgi:hypothetical protein